MKQTKEQTLSTLYALRAGLSVISQENDKANETSTDYENELVNQISIFDGNEHFLHENDSIDYYKKRYKEEIMDNNYEEKLLRKIERNKKENKQEAVRHNVWFLFLLFVLVALLGGIGTSLYFAVIKFMADEGWAWLGVLGTIIGIALFVNFCIGGCFEEFYWDTPYDCKADYKKIEYLPQLRITLTENEKEYITTITTIKNQCESMYIAMQNEFSDTLDVRDWKHLDLVIFYMETRRADSVKEALQLVDREMQTQRIEQTIIAATNQICNTLAVGFTMLQNTMESCFNSLSAQIAQSSAVVSSQLSGLTSAVNMNNALQAKANVTSEQLMNDLYYIRKYEL